MKPRAGPMIHLCSASNCRAWGSFGLGDHWWCRDHIPDHFWQFKHADEAGVADAPTTANDVRSAEPPLRQGRLL